MPSEPWKQRQLSRDHYRRNSALYKARASEWTARQRGFLAGYVRKVKEGQTCPDCGGEFPHYQLDFDHVRGKKHRNVADLVGRGVSLCTLQREIAKCEIVCRNCHAARTWLRAQQGVEPETADVEADETLRLFDP